LNLLQGSATLLDVRAIIKLDTRQMMALMDDDEFAELQAMLGARPAAGKVIPHSGGLRKLRWAGSGRGKRGGLRVIYYWWVRESVISLLAIYAKVAKPTERRRIEAVASSDRKRVSMEKKLFNELLQSVREMKAVRRGDQAPSRVWEVKRGPGSKLVRRQLEPEAYRRARRPEWENTVVKTRATCEMRCKRIPKAPGFGPRAHAMVGPDQLQWW
jgi:hypothetical protein